MGNQNQEKDWGKEMAAQMKNLQQSQEMFRRTCRHKPGQNCQVMSVHNYKGHVPDKDKLPETTAICTKCSALFESESYSRDETSSGIYMLNSILQQIKMVANLTDEDMNMIMEGFGALDKLSTIMTYYHNMVDKVAGGDKGNGGRRNNKGHIGVEAAHFGGGRNFN